MSNPNFLQTIVEYKKKVIVQKKEYYQRIKQSIMQTEYSRYSIFKKALSKSGQINLIAEIKKASPSKGIIREDFNIEQIAKIYDESGAVAISVLTEDKYFLGKTQYLKQVSDLVSIPTLMKDFIIDEGQIYDAFYCGASAVLLIVAMLADEQIKQFKNLADTLDIDCLVEVHDEAELDRAIKCGVEIIGVNNRNLTTFDVDIQTSEKLIPQIPDEIVTVGESGLSTYEDICRLKEAGANAVLIGETFMREKDIVKKLKEVMYGQS